MIINGWYPSSYIVYHVTDRFSTTAMQKICPPPWHLDAQAPAATTGWFTRIATQKQDLTALGELAICWLFTKFTLVEILRQCIKTCRWRWWTIYQRISAINSRVPFIQPCWWIASLNTGCKIGWLDGNANRHNWAQNSKRAVLFWGQSNVIRFKIMQFYSVRMINIYRISSVTLISSSLSLTQGLCERCQSLQIALKRCRSSFRAGTISISHHRVKHCSFVL